MGAKFGSCKYCGKGDITFLITYMTSSEHVIGESCDSHWFLLPQIVALPSLVVTGLAEEKLFRL